MSSQTTADSPLIFVHGWGLDAGFWNPLIAHFPERETHALNLGFRGCAETDVPPGKAVYVTHSYGTLWSLRHHWQDMAALIAINGFTDFGALTDARILKAMRLRLFQDPFSQMRDFFALAGYEAPTSGCDPQALLEGLKNLGNLHCAQELEKLDAPVLALLGAEDAIVPAQAAQQQFLGKSVKICENGGHMLPRTHTDWCAAQMKEFLQERP